MPKTSCASNEMLFLNLGKDGYLNIVIIITDMKHLPTLDEL